MSDFENHEPRRSLRSTSTLTVVMSVLCFVVVFSCLVAVFWSFLGKTERYASGKAYQTYAINNARQVIMALKLYAADNDGLYPDTNLSQVSDSNTVFDELIQEGIVTGERLFGSPRSIYQPDEDLGTPLTAGRDQVHWAFVMGRGDDSEGDSALVFENPIAVSGVGEPTWGPLGTEDRGRSWSGPRIVIGTNDGAVQTYPLDPEAKRLNRRNFTTPYGLAPTDLFSTINEETGEREELSWVGGR